MEEPYTREELAEMEPSLDLNTLESITRVDPYAPELPNPQDASPVNREWIRRISEQGKFVGTTTRKDR